MNSGNKLNQPGQGDPRVPLEENPDYQELKNLLEQLPPNRVSAFAEWLNDRTAEEDSDAS